MFAKNVIAAWVLCSLMQLALAAAVTVDAVKATATLGGGKAVIGAQGVALDPTTGLFYVALNGNIVAGCSGDAILTGSPTPMTPGAGQLSIVDPVQGKEIAAVASGDGPVWPTVDPARGVVYVANSGAGTVTTHDAATATLLKSLAVGGMPHMGGLDYSTRLMVVGNTVQSGDMSKQIYSTVVNTATNTVVSSFQTAPGPHAMAVDQDKHVVYYSSVGDGTITAVDSTTGAILRTGVPKSKYSSAFGNNNMLARQAATGRLFQVNSQVGFAGAIVVNESSLTAESLISFGSNVKPWGVWVDETNRLLFAALPNSDAIGVADLDTLTHVATIPVGVCPYAVAVDPARRVGLVTNLGSPSVNSTASILDLCPVYQAAGRTVAGCSQTGAAATAVEYYNSDLNHYFITADANEQSHVDSGSAGKWQRTGASFKTGGSTPVCRFYGNTVVNPASGMAYGPNSHFYTIDANECAGLKAMYNAAAKSWKFESNDFSATPPANGVCPSGLAPIYRAYNNGYAKGIDANHRLTADYASYQSMLSLGWTAEGIAMCTPP